MLAVIPYTTFPTIELGPLTLRTFGLFVALGVLIGAWIAAAYAERFDISRDDTYRVATWMVLAGIIGSRLTWAATHTESIENPVDVIAIWEGGIQFSGGFIAALVVGLPFFRRWTRVQRWQVLDGYSLGLAIGLALGRVGCYSVGEHFGRESDFFLANRYDGGQVREASLGDVPLQVGTTFHNTSLYELLWLLVLFAAMGGLLWRTRRRGNELKPGTLVGVFILVYGIARLLTDSLRVNDDRVLQLTGAQWMSLVMIPAGALILWKVRPRMAALVAAGAGAGAGAEAEAEATAEVDVDADADAGDAREVDAEAGDAEPEEADDGAEPEPATADAEPEEADAAEADAEAGEAGAERAEVEPSTAVADGADAEPEDAGSDAAAPEAGDGEAAVTASEGDQPPGGEDTDAAPASGGEPAAASATVGEGADTDRPAPAD